MKAPLKHLPSSAMGAVRVKGHAAPDWSLDVGRPPQTQALCGPQVVQGLWTGANPGRCGKASPGLFLSEARDLQCFLGGSSVFRSLKKWDPSLTKLSLAEPCRGTELWEEEGL